MENKRTSEIIKFGIEGKRVCHEKLRQTRTISPICVEASRYCHISIPFPDFGEIVIDLLGVVRRFAVEIEVDRPETYVIFFDDKKFVVLDLNSWTGVNELNPGRLHTLWAQKNSVHNGALV